ncbi:hypothetical protein DQ04_07531030 [Trypanosoma grayi]|uniref:hypothetical protein n=1 Tax=Trypanosoma grayi TaxID=71804 RepID=UPI0004F43042|nr:hypothetical protein DQ04_07531030 [Trypanosoma grayi]KEG08284.1 hypothetical protein DQ04_07531030 [Trypanosoma grayi]
MLAGPPASSSGEGLGLRRLLSPRPSWCNAGPPPQQGSTVRREGTPASCRLRVRLSFARRLLVSHGEWHASRRNQNGIMQGRGLSEGNSREYAGCDGPNCGKYHNFRMRAEQETTNG